MPRLVFTHCTPECVERGVAAFPGATFKQARHMASGPAVYVAHAPEHLTEYASWFKGVEVRAKSRVAHCGLPSYGGVYLPVTYNSWLMVVDGARGFGAAVEAARLLKDVTVVVCPAFGEEDIEEAARSLTRTYTRCQDRLQAVKDDVGT